MRTGGPYEWPPARTRQVTWRGARRRAQLPAWFGGMFLATACRAATPSEPSPAPDYSVVVGELAPNPVPAGDSAVAFLQSAFRHGFAQPVTFGLVAPTGFSARFDGCLPILTQQPFGPPPGVTCVMIVRVERAVPPGSYLLRVTAQAAGGAVKERSVTLGVVAAR
jgi:hypothetical protein